MEKRDFEILNEELSKVEQSEKLCMLLAKFQASWNADIFGNEFNLKYEQKEFLNNLAKKIVELGEYPMDAHSILLEFLNGKQMAYILNNIDVLPSVIVDFEDKFCSTKQVNDCVDFVAGKGVNFEKMQNRVLKSSQFDQYLIFVKNIKGADIKRFEERLRNSIEVEKSIRPDQLENPYSARSNKMRKKEHTLNQIHKMIEQEKTL